VGLTVVDPLAKFKECSFIHSRNIEGGLNFLKGHVTRTTPLSGEIFHPRGEPFHTRPTCQICRALLHPYRNTEGV